MSPRDAAFLPDKDASAAPERPASDAERAPWGSVLRALDRVGQDRATRPRRVGGKATGLARLVAAGFDVPRGWVLEARWFTRQVERALPRGYDLPTLIKLASTKGGLDRAARARDLILSTPVPDEVREAVAALWADVAPRAPWGLAVRSSATCEDADDTSLAGLAVTRLGVRGEEDLVAAIQEVWASAVLPRALGYLAHAGLRDLAMAVVLQPMVRAHAAGVMFTSPPPGLDGDAWHQGERLVNATFGLGAPVVEGASPVDHVRFARGGAVIDQVVASKPSALVVGDAGLELRHLGDAEARSPALDADALRQLAEIADRLEAGGAGPWDVEFAVERTPGEAAQSRVWLLQARAATGGGYPDGGDAQTVWSRTNVGEALPGAATPLTWSVARAFSERGFREAFAALGCKVPKDAVLVGNVYGRFYLNLTEFMRIAAQVPGLSPRVLLTASGGASPAAIELLERQAAEVSARGFLLRLPLHAPGILARQARLERDVTAYEKDAQRARDGLVELDLSLLPDDALATTLKGARALLDRTGELMLACASASLASHLALSTLLSRVDNKRASVRDEKPGAGETSVSASHLAHTLAGGARELDSAGPGVAMAQLADVVRGDAALRDALLAGKAVRLADLPAGAGREALLRFIEDFGDRAVREAELSTPRWREDPSTLLAMLVSALRAPPLDPEQALARARALADHELARLETRISRVELLLVRALVSRTQQFTRLRERMRTWVTRVLGVLRSIALDIDRRLRRIDPSLPEGSVFFCSYDELRAALSSGRAEVGHLVRLRHAEFMRDVGRPDPPPTFIGRPPPVSVPAASGTRWRGLPASGGLVEGLARVLGPGAADLDAVRAGEILVSRTTDVGLSPLFLVAAAVVTELGGPLSHAAVVAREYGIPAVVDVPGATTSIRTGDRLRVDGDRGIVERLDDQPPPSRRDGAGPMSRRGG